ncbi:MAG: response regulator [bacterium]
MSKEKEKLTVLLATDDEEFEESLLEILDENKYAVVVERSYPSAFHYLLNHEIDLLIFDPTLEELGGLCTLQFIKEIRPKIPIVVITDESSYDAGAAIARIGAYFRLGKPIDMQIAEEVVKSVARQLDDTPL